VRIQPRPKIQSPTLLNALSTDRQGRHALDISESETQPSKCTLLVAARSIGQFYTTRHDTHLDALDGAELREELLDLRRGEGPGQVGHVQLPPLLPLLLLPLRLGGLRGRRCRDGDRREAQAEARVGAASGVEGEGGGRLGNAGGRGGAGAAAREGDRNLGWTRVGCVAGFG
jgi:hypothetical protein